MVVSEKDNRFQRCSITVMDNISDPDILFDGSGISNYWYDYQEAAKNELLSEPYRTQELLKIIDKIKRDGASKKYDCLIGLSGGVDSSYLALLVKNFGLRPLAVHFDNGWNSELAVMNIENIVKKLNLDLYTLVVDWAEFRDIQLSYIKASVVDIEVVTDHAIFSTMYKLASKFDLKYIISGTNIVTEKIMPSTWIYNKMDFLNLKDIHQKFGTQKIKTYPHQSFINYVYQTGFRSLKFISLLNYVDYVKNDVKESLKNELDWRDYGGKHYESIFTKFYQAFILPEKFKIDKRKPHLSNLICSGQMTRQDAIEELLMPLYESDSLEADKEYVLKKLGLTSSQFDVIMNEKPRRHTEFKSDLRLKELYMNFLIKSSSFRRLFK